MFSHSLILDNKAIHLSTIPKFLGQEFVYGGHLQSLGATGVVWMSSLLLNIVIGLDILIVTYLVFYPIYLFNRLKELDIDARTNPNRSAYLFLTKKFLEKVFWLFPLAAILGLFVFSKPPGIVMGILILLFGMLYTYHFKNLTKIIAGFKNYYVASVFAILTFFPFFFYGHPLQEYYWISASLLALWIFGKIVVMQIILDLKDLEGDLSEKLKTIPVLLGEKHLLKILPLLILLATLPIPLIFSLAISVFPLSILGLLLSLFVTWYALYLIRNNHYEGYLLESGELISWPLFILSAQFFF